MKYRLRWIGVKAFFQGCGQPIFDDRKAAEEEADRLNQVLAGLVIHWIEGRLDEKERKDEIPDTIVEHWIEEVPDKSEQQPNDSNQLPPR